MRKNGRKCFLVILVLLTAVNIMGQSFDLIRAEGQVIAQGKNTTPIEGDGFALTSYRLELIPDFEASRSKTKQKYPPYKAVRLVLTGNFPSGNYIVWLNGAPNLAAIGPKGELYLIWINDQKAFEDELEIAVGSTYKKAVKLPESFEIPDEFKTPRRSEKELQNAVKLGYTSCDTSKPGGWDECILISTRGNPYLRYETGDSNHGWYLQIGESEFRGGPGRFVITRKQFGQLSDGDWIVIKTAEGPFGGFSVGKLNKSLLKK